MSGWNIADVLEMVAREVPESPVIFQGEREVSWREFDRRADNIAGYLLDEGIGPQSTVAQYLRNSPEYIESLFACLKASLIPVNTNYRYGADELVYLWDNAEVRAVVFHGEFTSTIDTFRGRVSRVTTWLWVNDGSGQRPDWAVDYEEVCSRPPSKGPSNTARSGDDLLLMYTGGTTGLPKGVMWRQDDLFVLLGNAAHGGYGDVQDLEFARSRVARNGRRMLPAAPLMHGAACFSCVPILARGGAVVLLEGRSFDAEELLDAVERHGVAAVSLVGDAFAKPIADALDAQPDRWDLSSLRTITSGGLAFSEATKRRLLDRVPDLLINDVFGASEAMTVGAAVATKDRPPMATGTFSPKADLRVIDESGRDVVPGSGTPGLLAFAGRQPVGYFRDEQKSAEVFRSIDGRRYAVAGDWATVTADGTVNFLGRGASCINTGGEKVFPSEVEEVISSLAGVVDVAVLGVPNERFGQAVVAVVETDGRHALTRDDVIAHARDRLAHYKAPREVLFIGALKRLNTGKVDLAALQAWALDELDLG